MHLQHLFNPSKISFYTKGEIKMTVFITCYSCGDSFNYHVPSGIGTLTLHCPTCVTPLKKIHINEYEYELEDIPIKE